MSNILDEIVAAKREELVIQKRAAPLGVLQDRMTSLPRPLDLGRALSSGGIQLIAEVKKASPSRGLLRADFDPVDLAGTYTSNGAAAVSVLTDLRFQGELDHIVKIKAAGASHQAPVLRKDFLFEPYQVYESRAAGADAILLIVAILTPQLLQELLGLSSSLGMRSLVEVHNAEELQVALDAGAEIVGINNRDLRTFNTDLAVTEQLATQVPKGKILVSESGISRPEHLRRLAGLGVSAVLVGEALLTAEDVAAKVRELSGQAIPSVGP